MFGLRASSPGPHLCRKGVTAIGSLDVGRLRFVPTICFLNTEEMAICEEELDDLVCCELEELLCCELDDILSSCALPCWILDEFDVFDAGVKNDSVSHNEL